MCRRGEGDNMSQEVGRFPERLQQLRERRRMSRRVLSELCGLSRSAISRYERGERQPRLDEATELAEFFDVSLDWLSGRSENKFT